MACLADLPHEILTQIAGHLAQDELVFPSDKTEFRYSPCDGDDNGGCFWAIRKWLPLYRPIYATRPSRSLRSPNKGVAALLNLAQTCKRLSEASSESIYRYVVVSDSHLKQLCNAVTTLAGPQRRLQPLVKGLAVSYYCAWSHGEVLGARDWERGVKLHLLSGLQNMATLSCIEIERFHYNPVQLDEWYRVLPKLPSLRKVSFRGCLNMDWQFPDLPQVQEAHFHQCSTVRWPEGMPSDGDPSHDSGAVAMFRKLPSLRTLVISNSFGTVPEEAFDVFEDNLETLGWFKAEGRFLTDLSFGCRLPIHRLGSLKHLKVDRFYPLFDGQEYRPETEKLLGNLETVEFAVPQFSQDFVGLEEDMFMSRQSGVGHLDNVLGTLETTCQRFCSKLRVIDLRCLTPRSRYRSFRVLRDVARERLNAAKLHFERMGATLLYDEFPVEPAEDTEDFFDSIEEFTESGASEISLDNDTWFRLSGNVLDEGEADESNDDGAPYI